MKMIELTEKYSKSKILVNLLNVTYIQENETYTEIGLMSNGIIEDNIIRVTEKYSEVKDTLKEV